MGNKIRIPWYRFKPKSNRDLAGPLSGGGLDGAFPPVRFPKPRLRPRPRMRAQEEPVREPVDEKVRERDPARVPQRYPILDPRQLPDPKNDPGSNPYRSPAPGTLPLPTPIPGPTVNPRRDPGKNPGVNQKQPMPQRPALPFDLPSSVPSPIPPEGYQYNPAPFPSTRDNRQWTNDFISDIDRVATLTGLKALDIYIFMRDYDYANRSLGDFSLDAQQQFGLVAGTVLATVLAAKSLAELWGARAAAGFSPMIKFDEEFMNEYFGTDQQIY